MEQDWFSCQIETTVEALPIIEGYLVGHGIGGLQIHDPADFAEFLAGEGQHWDYLDDALYDLQDAPPSVTFYLPKNGQGIDSYREILEGLPCLRTEFPEIQFGSLVFTEKTVREEDWANAWKQYYHPMEIGKRLYVCPSWELEAEGEPPFIRSDGRAVLVLDPGMAFGTGGHASTRLCLTLLDEIIQKGNSLLDLGCGSGILSVAGLLLGCEKAFGVDIDEKAVTVSAENAARSGVRERFSAVCGDLTAVVTETYDIICANIVADVIIRLLPDMGQFLKENGQAILSGIIVERKPEIIASLDETGYRVVEEKEEDGWCALLVRKK